MIHAHPTHGTALLEAINVQIASVTLDMTAILEGILNAEVRQVLFINLDCFRCRKRSDQIKGAPPHPPFSCFFLVRRCDKIPVPPKGSLKGGDCNRNYLSTCEVICQTGYELSGNGKRQCVMSAANFPVWSGSDVFCNRKLSREAKRK